MVHFVKYSAGCRYSSPSIGNDKSHDSKPGDIGNKVGYHSCMSHAIRAADCQHPAPLLPSTNDENEDGGRKKEGLKKEGRLKKEEKIGRNK